MVSPSPLLIVNADDFGRNVEATDRTIEAFHAGQLSSATAMVHMADSERAASLALDAGLPVGLHVNFTTPFDGDAIPPAVRACQLTACRHFSGRRFKLRSWSYDPYISDDVDAAAADQLHRFEELYLTPALHFDGHHHVHACPNVILSAPLRRVGRTRNNRRSWPSATGPMSRLRGLRRTLTYRHLLTTRYFFDIDKLFRDPTAASLAAHIDLGNEASVEVMCHPGVPHEMAALKSELWAQALKERPLGCYRDLVDA